MDHTFLSSLSFSAFTDSMYSFFCYAFSQVHTQPIMLLSVHIRQAYGSKEPPMDQEALHQFAVYRLGAAKNINFTCQMFDSLLGRQGVPLPCELKS